MRIAIAAPSPDPFVVGGAEKLWWGMQRHFNEKTTHYCELFKLQVKESTVGELLDAYYRFFLLDLSSFDRVITTKYPAFLVQHPDHHLYLQHLLRGCYDTYPAGLSTIPPWSDPEICHLLHTISRGDISLEAIFSELFNFLDKKGNVPQVNALPGPFIRHVLHILDRRAMEGVRCFSAISRTVKMRRDYFPPAARVKVIHHPSNLTHFEDRSREFYFTASRLDGPKRIDLLIKGFMQSKADCTLLIAGTGPQEDELKKLAKDDLRIRFLGFISDDDLKKYYMDARAVVYVPFDEDYGLITIEALQCGKPVITCADSGGVTELVVDGVNGRVVNPDSGSLAEAIDSVETMQGEDVALRCKRSVAEITWQRLLDNFTEEDGQNGTGFVPRQKAVAVSTYPLSSLSSGGQLRLYNTLRRLSCRYDITLLALGGHSSAEQQITPYFKEYVIAETGEFIEQRERIEKRLGISAADLAFMLHYNTIEPFVRRFKETAEQADLVICVQPYVYPLVRDHFDGTILYDSHNMEYLLKKTMTKTDDEEVFQQLFATEKALCQRADLVIACAAEDVYSYKTVYQLPDLHSCVLPNGVDAVNTPFLSLREKAIFKQKFSINRPVALFIGSGHQPNVDAVKKIVNFAGELADIAFIVIGSVANAFAGREKAVSGSSAKIPENVGFAGVVSDYEKEIYLQLADIALNPMESGGGSNLKLAEYIAAGIPVISTPLGTRGYEIDRNELIDVVEIENFTKALAFRLANCDETRLTRARESVIARYDWDAIMGDFPIT